MKTNPGIVLGTAVLVPLLAFALLWTSLLLIIGVGAALSAVGLA